MSPFRRTPRGREPVTRYCGYVRQQRPQGQWFTSETGQRWWFDPGALSLDFAYTGAMPPQPESWSTPVDLGAWLAERFEEVDAAVTERDLTDARALRSALAAAFLRRSLGEEPEPDDVDVINLFAATPDIPPALAGGRRQAGRTRARPSQALSTLAREAIVRLDDEHRARIRACEADDCGYVFYDESRSANRRWCSMQRCGNRAKVRKHRALKQSAA